MRGGANPQPSFRKLRHARKSLLFRFLRALLSGIQGAGGVMDPG